MNYHVIVNDSGNEKTYYVSDDEDRANMVLRKVLSEGKKAKIITKPDYNNLRNYLNYL